MIKKRDENNARIARYNLQLLKHIYCYQVPVTTCLVFYISKINLQKISYNDKLSPKKNVIYSVLSNKIICNLEKLNFKWKFLAVSTIYQLF